MSQIRKKALTYWKRLVRQARIFIGQGFLVVPIPPRKKAPQIKGWTEYRLEIGEVEDAFGQKDNIGVILGDPSRGLNDVDLDCPEARAVAPFLLPATGLISGRESSPDSHWWYIANPSPDPMKFSDGDVLLELRSTGQQTLIPPSLHPLGEALEWSREKSPARVDPAELEQAVRRVAAATLLARHWPIKGSRHELTLAIAGFLLRNDWSVEETKNFITAIARASGSDEEWKARQRDVETTLSRLEKGEPATGIPKLVTLLGNEVVTKLADWLQIPQGHSAPMSTHIETTWPNPPEEPAFRGLAGEFVSLVEPHSEADPVALLSQFLVGFGNVIGRRAHFQVEADRHHTNLFIALVGPTSKARKGSSLSQVMRVLKGVDSQWANNCVVSGLSSGEGLIWAVRDATLSKDDTKFVDVGVEDKRLFTVEPEFAQPLKLMGRNGNVLSTVLRQAWDSGNLRTLTKNSPAQATDAHISVITHITQQELRRYLNQTEVGNGFANRFLFFSVKRSKSLPEGGKLDERDLHHLTDRLLNVVRWARGVEAMDRSDKARKLWARIYPELSQGSAGLLGAVTSRAEAQVTRLSVLYALLDRSSTIQTQHLKAGLALWDHAQASAKFIFGDSLGDPVADEILRALRISQSGLTRTEISNLFGGHRKSADISQALVVLVQNGLASSRPEATGGRPDERWFVLVEGAKNAN